MTTKNSGSKYRLLVLMDLSKASEIVLKNAVQLAKVIDGHVEVLYVKGPADVVECENQYAAVRSIHEDYKGSKLRFRRIIRKTEKENRISVTYRMAYGSIRKAIKEYMSKNNPDIVLLGKTKSSLADLFRQSVTKFVLKHCNVNVLIVGEDQKFHSYEDVSLGVYGEIIEQKGFEIIKDLKQQNNNPIRFFRIGKQKDSQEQFEIRHSEQNAVSYVFSEGANAIDSLAAYISRTNTQLFCIPRRLDNNGSSFRYNGVEIPVNQVIQRLDIPVLIVGS